MKLVNVITTLTPNGGAENLVVNSAIEMTRKGISTTIATIYKYRNKYIRDKAIDNGVKVISIDLNRFLLPVALYRINNEIARTNYTVIHSHLFPANYLVALCNKQSAKIVTTEHSTFNTRRTIKGFRPIEKFIYNRYDKIICISPSVHNSLNFWIPSVKHKFQVINNGIYFDDFANPIALSRDELGVPKNCNLICMIARFSYPKDHATLLRAVSLLPNIHLLLAGDGEGVKTLRNLAQELQIMHRVHFLGFRADIAAIMKACDLVVHATEFEGFCLVLVEAMASGVPCLISDIPAAKEILSDNLAECMFKNKDYKALANKISRFLSDSQFKTNILQITALRARDFSIEKHVTELIDCYKKIDHPIDVQYKIIH
jgi:glycosyltransferase involved in cell wall biosynthesis